MMSHDSDSPNLGSLRTRRDGSDHRWLIGSRGKDKWWRQTIDLNFRTHVRTIRCEPTDIRSLAYRAGYIAGATAGDGTFRWNPPQNPDGSRPQVYWRVAKPATDGVVLVRLAEYLKGFGVAVEIQPFDSGISGFSNAPVPMAKVETRRAENLATIASLCSERSGREWVAGWLAGMFDTDASYSGGNLRYCQSKPNGVLDQVVRYAKELGYEFRREEYEGGTGSPTARLVGGIAENLAFLAAISPALERRCRDFYGKRVETVDVPVVGVRRGPAQRLVDITTSTGTFIAEGALTHNCYALTMAGRLKAMGQAKYQTDGDPRTSGPGFGVAVHDDALTIPLRWRKPRKVFVDSMSDLFHADVPDEFIARVFAVMAGAPQHTYQLLTKRHARMRSLLNDLEWRSSVFLRESVLDLQGPARDLPSWPLPNLWLGVSVEDQQWADIRIPALLDTPAAVRWISAEPLLGPVDMTRWLYLTGASTAGPWRDWRGERRITDGRGRHLGGGGIGGQTITSIPSSDLGWLVVGGESGPGARPMELDWARSLVRQCQAAGVPAFVKQLGPRWGRDHHDISLFPPDLQIREYPEVSRVG